MDNMQRLLARMQHPKLDTIDLGLERVERFLALLGSPHHHLPPVIHVAGTNGKGSLLAYISAIFAAAGYKAHRYISPHLVTFNERITLAGEIISDAELQPLLERVAAKIDQQPVTFFESTTAAAFLAFAEHKADIVLLETGLGGRLDATNVIARPTLTVITPISHDHSTFLGDTIPKIAVEKAGILKQNIPCVIGKQSPEAQSIIEARASELSAPLFRYGKEWFVHDNHYQSNNRTIALNPSLAGAHQYDNAATAIACIDQLPQFGINDTHIASGLANTYWPARLQHLTDGRFANLLLANIELWLDGGHNPQGGEILAAWLQSRQLPAYLICGMMKDKDSAGFLRPIAPLVQELYTVPIPGEANAQTPEQLRHTALESGIAAFYADSVENALKTIARHAKTPSIICICGSLYLAGSVLAANAKGTT